MNNDTAGSAKGNTSNQGKGTTNKTIEDIQNAWGKAEDTFKDSFKSTQDHINEKPVQSALIALGIGFLIGKIFG
jgi:ElaB/YqjD/DUF883 family membrane-anchored ribosome-binding protein